MVIVYAGLHLKSAPLFSRRHYSLDRQPTQPSGNDAPAQRARNALAEAKRCNSQVWLSNLCVAVRQAQCATKAQQQEEEVDVVRSGSSRRRPRRRRRASGGRSGGTSSSIVVAVAVLVVVVVVVVPGVPGYPCLDCAEK